MNRLIAKFSILTALLSGCATALEQQPAISQIDETITIKSEAASFRVEIVAQGLDVPWAMEFLADGNALVGDRKTGLLHRLNIATGALTPISGLPTMLLDSEISAGLFDVRVHPDFINNGWVYIAYAAGSREASGLVVERMKLVGNTLTEGQQIFESRPRTNGKHHFGGRLAFADGYLFITIGEGFSYPHLAQDLSTHPGKVLRIHDNGEVPKDNPFVDVAGALPEIWAYGIRNPQGLTVHPETGKVWQNEHGPQGGDEVNIIERGVNYGWPIITYGEQYEGGPIGDGITHKEGMQQPLYYWLPSIAPSGMEFYTGKAFPGWQGSVFVGALALKHLNRLVVDGERVLHEERLFEDQGWRVRFIEEGPDGNLYFGVDGGMIMRLVPATAE